LTTDVLKKLYRARDKLAALIEEESSTSHESYSLGTADGNQSTKRVGLTKHLADLATLDAEITAAEKALARRGSGGLHTFSTRRI
jgi:uncharacterized tellurite resistance protein B-like protein